MPDTTHRTEIRIGIRDMASGVARGIARSLTALNRTAMGLGRGGLGAIRLGAGAASLGLSGVAGAARLTTSALRGVGSVGVGSLRAATGAARTFGLVAAASFGLAAYASSRLMQTSIQEFAEREAMELGLRNLLNNAQVYRAVMEELKQIAKLPAIDMSGAVGGFQQLQSAGAPVRMSLDLVREMGNAVAMAGGGAEQYRNVIRGLGQTFGKAAVSAEELNTQIFEGAPMVRRAVMAAFPGMSMDKILAMRLTGVEFWQRVLPALRALPRAGNGAKNAIENVGIAWKEVRIAFGRGLMSGGASSAFGGLEERLNRLIPKAEAFGKRIAVAFDTVTKALRPYMQAGGALGGGFLAGLLGTKGDVGGQAGGGLGAALVKALQRGLKAAGLSGGLLGLMGRDLNGQGGTAMVGPMQRMVQWATKAGQTFRGWLVSMAERLPRVIVWLRSAATWLWNLGGALFGRNWSAAGALLRQAFAPIGEALSSAWAWGMAQIEQNGAKWATSVWNALKPIASAIWTHLVTALGQALTAAKRTFEQMFPQTFAVVSGALENVRNWFLAVLPAAQLFVTNLGALLASKEFTAGLRSFATSVASIATTLVSQLPKAVPVIQSIAAALASIPWGDVASNLTTIIDKIGSFVKDNPWVVALMIGDRLTGGLGSRLGGSAVGSVMGGSAGKWILGGAAAAAVPSMLPRGSVGGWAARNIGPLAPAMQGANAIGSLWRWGRRQFGYGEGSQNLTVSLSERDRQLLSAQEQKSFERHMSNFMGELAASRAGAY